MVFSFLKILFIFLSIDIFPTKYVPFPYSFMLAPYGVFRSEAVISFTLGEFYLCYCFKYFCFFFFHFLIVCLLLCSIFLSFSFIVPISSSFLLSMGFLSLVHKSDFFLSYPFCSLSPILHTLFQLLYFCYLILFLSSSYILASYGLYCSLSLLVGFIRLIIYY